MTIDNLSRPIPLLLSTIFIVLLLFFRIPSYWESGFHTSYFYIMLCFFAYILHLFSRKEPVKDKVPFFKSFGKTLFVVLSLYIGMYTIFSLSDKISIDKILQLGILSAVCVIIYLLFQMRVEQPKAKDNDVFDTSYKDDLRRKIDDPKIDDTEKQSLLEKYNKSYIATVLTQPLYVVIDLFGIIKCLFSDKEERQKIQSLLAKYFKDHKYPLLIIGSLSTYLYFWFRNISIQLNPNALSKTLVPNNPLSLNQQYVIGKQSEGIRTYNYSVSGWVFIEQPVDNENREFKIIDYAGAPILTYNPSNQMIYAYINKSENGKLVRVMEYDGMKHQRWNYFVLNSSDGVLDIFWNTTLIATIDNIVPYMRNDAFLSGEFQGIRGGIRNVEYRENPINMLTMYLSYYFM